jgi:hypothetical protein
MLIDAAENLGPMLFAKMGVLRAMERDAELPRGSGKLARDRWRSAVSNTFARLPSCVWASISLEDDEWRRAFDEPFDVTRARDLLIEFVGGEPAAQLRDQFAAWTAIMQGPPVHARRC